MLPPKASPRLRVELGEVDLDSGVLHGADGPVRLTETEAALLRHLACRAGEIVHRSALHEAVWNHAPSVVSRAVDQAVRRLRAKIEREPSEPRHLQTVHGVGYRLVPWEPSARVVAEPAAEDVLVVGDRRIDLARASVDTPAGRQRLTAAEVDILRALRELDGRILGRSALKRAGWGGRATTDRAVTNTVHRLRAKLGPGRLLTVRGAGYRLLEGEQAASPTNLIEPCSTFVARRCELLAVREALRHGARLLTLVGAAGIGKTRLAIRAAGLSRHAFPGGVWWCDLSEARTRDEIVASVGAVLGVGTAEGGAISAALQRRGGALVVLDNFEQIVGHAADTVGRWRAEARESTFVVTSRERLRLDGEDVLVVGPLDDEDGGRLFAERALKAGARWDPDAWADAIAAIVASLDGIPLAVELAAARATLFDPGELRQQLHDPFALLTTSRRDAPARHTTLRAALDWSWRLLSEDERTLLVQLAVFESGFDWQAVLAASGAGASESVVLERLVDKSMVRVLPGSTSRFALFATIRAYAAERSDALVLRGRRAQPEPVPPVHRVGSADRPQPHAAELDGLTSSGGGS
jgi:predicted ATPase/DNA-binding response OmpR family regulator